jgi:cell division transport system permease protein
MNLSQLSKFVVSKLEIRVFLNQRLTDTEVDYFRSILEETEGIKSVEMIDRDKAWEEFSKTYQALELHKFSKENPLPHALKVSLTNKKKLVEISKKIEGYSYYVESTMYGGDLSLKLRKLSTFLLIGGWSLVILLSVSTLFIVVNTIKLTVINRREEIAIMKLVGATDFFIMAPFLIEALILGLFSSLFVVGLLIAFNAFLFAKLIQFLPFIPFHLSFDQLWFVYIIVIVWGSFLTGLAAVISIRSTLKKLI